MKIIFIILLTVLVCSCSNIGIVGPTLPPTSADKGGRPDLTMADTGTTRSGDYRFGQVLGTANGQMVRSPFPVWNIGRSAFIIPKVVTYDFFQVSVIGLTNGWQAAYFLPVFDFGAECWPPDQDSGCVPCTGIPDSMMCIGVQEADQTQQDFFTNGMGDYVARVLINPHLFQEANFGNNDDYIGFHILQDPYWRVVRDDSLLTNKLRAELKNLKP